MIKYFHFARIALEDHLRNRLRLFTRFVICMMLMWVMTGMWRVIYGAGHAIPAITLNDMSWYTGLTQMMVFLSPRTFVVIDEDVRSGNVGYFLNRPMPYLWMRFAEGLGALFGNIVIFYSLCIPFIYFLIGDFPSSGSAILIPVLVLITIGSVLHLLFQVFCGLSTFWTNDATFMYHSYQKMLILLGGVYAPIMLYPPYFFPEILRFLPFAAMLGDVMDLCLTPNRNVGYWAFFETLSIQCFWIAAMLMILKCTYHACLRRVEVNGG